MNKEQAEICIKITEDALKTTSKGIHYKFLPINLICLVIAIALYHELIFAIMILAIVGLNIIFVVVLAKKKPFVINAIILLSIQMIVFCIALNCLIFGLYKLVDLFILWEFLLSIVIQIMALGISVILVKKHADNYKEKEKFSKVEVITGVAGGLGYTLALILCRIFTPSLSIVILILTLLMNLLVYLFNFAIVAAIYRIYLIKKYNLNAELKADR